MHRLWEDRIAGRNVKIWRFSASRATVAVAILVGVAETLLDMSGGLLVSLVVNAGAIMLTSVRTPTATKDSGFTCPASTSRAIRCAWALRS